MTETIVNLLIAFSLLAANAFYVAAEFALVKSRGFRINAMVEQNRFGAALLEPVLAQFGMSDSALHFTSFMVGFLLFSSLHIVIGEQVPKTLAIREPGPVSQWIAYPLYFSFLLLYPLNWLLNAAS